VHELDECAPEDTLATEVVEQLTTGDSATEQTRDDNVKPWSDEQTSSIKIGNKKKKIKQR